jgi:type IV pilus assembly protein PilP
VDKIKVALTYVLGGVGSLIVAFVWISPVSHAQEANPADPNLRLQNPPTKQDLPVPPPPQAATSSTPAPAPSAPPPATGAPADAATANQQIIEGVQGQAGDFLAPYIFDTREGRRNPFRPMMLKDDNNDRAAIGPATPLERYDIDELKLIAIMWEVKSPKAMVMDPNKEIHIIGKDDRIGRRQGYVATIREGELVVVETTDFNGETVYSTRVMRIEK